MVDIKDVQGFLLRGYKRMRTSCFIMLRVEDMNLAKQWMGGLKDRITNGTHYPKTTCLNLAVTHAGLGALGMNDANRREFSREFREGSGYAAQATDAGR